MFDFAYLLKVLYIFIFQFSLFLQHGKCYPNLTPKVVNFIPYDDCPKDSLCENPLGYPQEFIRRALMRDKVLTKLSTQAAYNPPEYSEGFQPISAEEFVPRVSIPNYASIPEDVKSEADVKIESSVLRSSSFSNLKEIEHYNAPVYNETAYASRNGPEFGSHSFKPELCPSLIKTIRPKSGTTVHNEKLYIINEEEILVQEIDIQICGSSVREAECKYIEVIGSRAVCSQKYIIKELISLRQDGKLQLEGFKIPFNCCCDLIDL